MPHKHCKHCGLDFEPRNQWEEYCPPPKKCVEDDQKLHPPALPNLNPNLIILPGWNTLPPDTNQAAPIMQFWHCGVCGRAVAMSENHVHTFTFTTGG